MSSYQYRDAHDRDNMVSWPFYLYNRNTIPPNIVFTFQWDPGSLAHTLTSTMGKLLWFPLRLHSSSWLLCFRSAMISSLARTARLSSSRCPMRSVSNCNRRAIFCLFVSLLSHFWLTHFFHLYRLYQPYLGLCQAQCVQSHQRQQ